MTRRNILLAILLVSVAANLVFIGGIGYRTLSINQARASRPVPPNLGWLVEDLSAERRAELRANLRASSEEVRPLRDEIEDAQRVVNSLMTAEPFDAAALQSAFAQLRAVSERYQEATQSQTIAILEQLTHEERLAAESFILRQGPRGARRGSGPGAGPGGRPPPRGLPPGSGRPPPRDGDL